MAEFAGYVASGITDQSGAGGRANLPQSTNVLAGRALPSAVYRAVHTPEVPFTSAEYEIAAKTALPVLTFGGYEDQGLAPFWFELVHSFPSFFEFGNLLAAVTRDIHVYSSYRLDDVTLQTVTQDAGAGVTLSGISGLPIVLLPETGFTFQVNVGTTGPPTLDGDIVATFDVAVLTIPMTGTRVVMFPYQPESPLEEMLEFNTTVLESADNTEQRIALRKNPRQKFSMLVRHEDEAARRKMQSLLFGWQPGVFGVPVWFEAKYLAVDAPAGATTIQVDTTYADYRNLSLAIVWQDENNFDALEVSSFTSTSLTFSSPLTRDYAAGQALVMPLRVAHTASEIAVRRAHVNLEDTQLVFTVIDNDSDLGDTAAWPTYNGKVLLSEDNKMDSSYISAGQQRLLHRLDNRVNAPVQSSDWPGPVYITQKGFHCGTPQRLWEIRQLLHALRGQQKTFYLPTFYHDMVVVTDTINGDTALEIEAIDYSTYIDGQAPSNHLWIQLTDGTVYTKEIVSSIELTPTVERLTLGDTWASIIPAANFARVSYLRTARITEDSVRLVHSAAGETDVSVLVREVTG